MDKPSDCHQTTSSLTQQNASERLPYPLEPEMNRRHFLYDKNGSRKKDWFSFHSRFPKLTIFTLRRSWNLKLLLLMLICALTVVCVYSGVLSLLVPSFSYNLVLGQSDGIKAPRVAIQLGPEGILKKDRSHRDDRGPNRAGEEDHGNWIDTNENVDQQVPKGVRRLPSSIIFGVSKCGTRAILEYLKLHPDVVAPMPEINFFNNYTLLNRGIEWYLQQMPLAQHHQMVVEKSPDYFQNPECAPMIRRLNSSMKLLLLLRDPVERLVSQYMQFLAKNPNLPRFEDWVMNPATQRIKKNIPSVMVSAYSKHLEKWLAVFPMDQILIIESNDLRQNPYTEMKRVETFLDLKPFIEPSDFYFNSTRGFYCLKHRSTGKIKCLGKSKGRRHTPVDQHVMDILHSFYEPYNKRLNALLGTKFPWS